MEWAELLSELLVFVISCVGLVILVFACIGINTVYRNYKDSKWQKEYGDKLKEDTKHNQWENMEQLRDKVFLLEELIKKNGIESNLDGIDRIISDVNYGTRYNDYKKIETKWNVFAITMMGTSEKAQTNIQEDFEKYEKQRKQELWEKLDGIIKKGR